MKKEVISVRQGVALIILFIIGSTVIVGAGSEAKQDTWIAIIISIFWATILLLMFSRILSLYPGKDLFDILQLVMGKFIGTFISILMIWFAYHLGSIVIRDISEFTSVAGFPDTPVILPMFFLILLLIWGLKEGIEVIGRWSEFFIWVVALIFIFTSMLSIPQMDINRIKPILNSGLFLIIRGAFSSLSFPFGETVVFTMVFSNVGNGNRYYKTFMLGLIIGGFFIVLGSIRNLIILDSKIMAQVYFPSAIAANLTQFGELFQRLEMGAVIVLLVCAFVKIIICLFAVCNGISKVFGFDDYRFIATPVTLLMLSFSSFVYKSTMEMATWSFNIWPYYSFIFEVIIPLIVFIAAEIKMRIASK